jgi:HK97 gp10 family phage protein
MASGDSKPSRESAYRSARRYGPSVGRGGISIDTTGFSAQIAALREKMNAATRPAAQAGAQVIYEMARLNVHSSSKGHWFHGKSFRKTGQKYWIEPGSLHDAIYQAFSRDKSTDSKATYHINVRLKDAPYAYMVEFGTSRAPAHSFMTKALVEGSAHALESMRQTFIERMKQ